MFQGSRDEPYLPSSLVIGLSVRERIPNYGVLAFRGFVFPTFEDMGDCVRLSLYEPVVIYEANGGVG